MEESNSHKTVNILVLMFFFWLFCYCPWLSVNTKFSKWCLSLFGCFSLVFFSFLYPHLYGLFVIESFSVFGFFPLKLCWRYLTSRNSLERKSNEVERNYIVYEILNVIFYSFFTFWMMLKISLSFGGVTDIRTEATFRWSLI